MNSLPDRLGLCCITELYRDRGPMWRFRTVTHIPDVVKKHRDVTWECEVKAKDRAILALHGEEQLNIK